jgi:membrane protein required for colicin V production
VICPDTSGVDLAMAGVMALSVTVGAVRGLVFEVLSLVGWLVAYAAMQAFSPWTAAHLPVGAADSSLRQALALGATFIGALILWFLFARVVRMLIRATPLTVIDRLLGAGFGALRAVILLLVATLVVLLTPLAANASWRCAQTAGWLTAAATSLRPWLPDAVAQRLPDRN